MNEIYSLLQHDILHSPEEIMKILNMITEFNLFDSSELYSLLDEFKISVPGELVDRIISFNQSSINMELKIPDIREVILN